jgi:hypothetical protein
MMFPEFPRRSRAFRAARRGLIARCRTGNLPFLLLALAGVPVFADTMDLPEPQSVTSLTRIMERWQKLVPIEVRIEDQQVPHVVPARPWPDEVLWDRSSWRLVNQGLLREVTLRFFRGDFELTDIARRVGDPVPQLNEAMSYVRGEFTLLNEPEGKSPRALIDDRVRSSTLLIDKFLTVFELEFFDTRAPWPDVIRSEGLQPTGIDTIDGIACVRLENNRDTDGHELSMWLDPNRDYAPVRALRLSHGDSGASWSELRINRHQMAGDTWIAKDAEIMVCSPAKVDDCQVHRYSVRLVGAGAEHQPRPLWYRLPEGTRVQDYVHNEEWTADGAGGRRETEPLDRETLEAIRESIEADIMAPELARSRRYAVYGVFGLTVAIVAAVVLVGRRRG